MNNFDKVTTVVRDTANVASINSKYPSLIARSIMILWDLACVAGTIVLGSFIGNEIYHNNTEIQPDLENPNSGLKATTEIADRLITIYIFVIGFSFAACIQKIVRIKQVWGECMTRWCELLIKVQNISQDAEEVKVKGAQIILLVKLVSLQKRRCKSSIFFYLWSKFSDSKTAKENEKILNIHRRDLFNSLTKDSKSFEMPGNPLSVFMSSQYAVQYCLETTILPYLVGATLHVLMGAVSAATLLKLKVEYQEDEADWPYYVCYLIMTMLYLPLFAAYHMTPSVGSIFRTLEDSVFVQAQNSINTIISRERLPEAIKQAQSSANTYRKQIQKIDI